MPLGSLEVPLGSIWAPLAAIGSQICSPEFFEVSLGALFGSLVHPSLGFPGCAFGILGPPSLSCASWSYFGWLLGVFRVSFGSPRIYFTLRLESFWHYARNASSIFFLWFRSAKMTRIGGAWSRSREARPKTTFAGNRLVLAWISRVNFGFRCAFRFIARPGLGAPPLNPPYNHGFLSRGVSKSIKFGFRSLSQAESMVFRCP